MKITSIVSSRTGNWSLSSIKQWINIHPRSSFAYTFATAKSTTWERAAAAAKALQSCPTLCDPIDGSPPGSAVPGILQARTLEWVAISFSNAWKWKEKVKSLSHIRPSATPWTAAYQAPLSMGFSRYEYWSGMPLPSPRERAVWKWAVRRTNKINSNHPFCLQPDKFRRINYQIKLVNKKLV